MDINTIAYRVVQQSLGQAKKKSAARAKAGKLGGTARAKRLSKAQRHQIAVKANSARWSH